MNRWIGILLLNLVFLGCEAQETDSLDAGFFVGMGWINSAPRVMIDGRLVYDELGNLIGYETGDIINGQYHELPSLEDKLLRYGQECYNDSSRYCSYLFCDNGCVEIECDCDKPFTEYCSEKYIHREPTLGGFIEWLKENK